MAGQFRISASPGQFRNPIRSADKAKAKRSRDKETVEDLRRNRREFADREAGFINAWEQSIEKTKQSANEAHNLEVKWDKAEKEQRLANFKLKAEQEQLKAKSSIKMLDNLAELAPKAAEVVTKFKDKAEQAEIEEFQWIQRSLGLTNKELVEMRLTDLTYEQINRGEFSNLQKLLADKQISAKDFNILTAKSGHITRAFQKIDRDRINLGFTPWITENANAGNTVDMGDQQIPFSAFLSSNNDYSPEQIRAAFKQAQHLYYKQDSTASTYKPGFLNSGESYTAYQNQVNKIEAGITKWETDRHTAQAEETLNSDFQATYSRSMTSGQISSTFTDQMNLGSGLHVRNGTMKRAVQAFQAGTLNEDQLRGFLNATYKNKDGKVFKVGSVNSLVIQVEDAIYAKRTRTLGIQQQLDAKRKYEAKAKLDEYITIIYSSPEGKQQAHWNNAREMLARDSPELVAYWNTFNPAIRDAARDEAIKKNVDSQTSANHGILTKDIIESSGAEGQLKWELYRKLHEQTLANPGRKDHIEFAESSFKNVIASQFKNANLITGESTHPYAKSVLRVMNGRFLSKYNQYLLNMGEEDAYSKAVQDVNDEVRKEFVTEGSELFVQTEDADGNKFISEPLLPGLIVDPEASFMTRAEDARKRFGPNFLSEKRLFDEHELRNTYRNISQYRDVPSDMKIRMGRLADKYGMTINEVIEKQLNSIGVEEMPPEFKEKMDAQSALIQQSATPEETRRLLNNYEKWPNKFNEKAIRFQAGEIHPRAGYDLQSNTSGTFISRHLDHSYGPSELKGFNYTSDPNHSGANGHLDLGFTSRDTNNWAHDFLAELGIVSTEVKDRGAGVTVAHNTEGEITHAKGYKMDIPLDHRNGLKHGPIGNENDYYFVAKVYRSLEFGLGQMELGRDPKTAAQMFANQDYVGAI